MHVPTANARRRLGGDAGQLIPTKTVALGEAADLLGVSDSTLRRWSDDGRVTAQRTDGGHRRFRVSELRNTNGQPRPRLRMPSMPHGPLPRVSALLLSDGSEVAWFVARSLYEGPGGWFVQAHARPPTAAWIAQLAASFRDGRYEPLTSALERYLRSAEAGGASLAERHTFVERFGGALRRRLNHRGCPPGEQAAASRAMAVLAHRALAGDSNS